MLTWIRRAARRFGTIKISGIIQGGDQISFSGLQAIPPELIEHITSFLTLSDAACLALCSKHLYRQLGTRQRWELLRTGGGHEDERTQFLQQLIHQDPRFYICYTCLHLHLVSKVGPALHFSEIRDPALRWRRPSCINFVRHEDCPRALFTSHMHRCSYELTFAHIQLALCRHRNGSNHGISLDFLKATEVRFADDMWALSSVEPKIIDDEIFLRVQQWKIFEPAKPPILVRYKDYLPVCKHIDAIASSAVVDMLQLLLQHAREQTTQATSNVLRRCTQCAIEFEIEERRLEDGKCAVVITKWGNFGTGESPSDHKWQRHLTTPSYLREICASGPNKVSLRRLFEQDEGAPQEEALRCHELLLSGDKFRTTLQPSPSFADVWLDR